MSRKSSPRPREGPPFVVNDTNSGPKSPGTNNEGVCAVCLKEFKAKHSVNDISRRRRFCSGVCRRRAWAVVDLAKALEAGKAEGLRETLKGFGR